MVRKKLATAILAISAMQAGWVSALGLGEATLKSSLNQPLVAVINLNDLGDLSADQVVIKMASADDFKRADVERNFFLNTIKFDVQLDGRGGGIVRVLTREPVNEPYLNFVIEARWPNGRMLREYSLLLDLPVFSQGGTATIDSATTSAVGAAIERADRSPENPVADRPRRATSASRTSPAPSSYNPDYKPVGEGQHRVESNETLWRIATNNRPAGFTVPQTVVAIHRMNPEAFANGDMNLMKKGAVLRLPSAADVAAINGQQASAEVARARQETPAARGPELDTRTTEAPAPSAPVEESRLSIATAAEPKTDAATNAGTGTGSADKSALRDELSAAQENLDRAQREKAELENRVGDMERQMGTLQKLLQLKDEQLNALQAQTADKKTPATESAPEAAASQSTAPETAPPQTTAAEPSTATDTAQPAVAEVQKPAAETAKQPETVAPAPVAEKPKSVSSKPASAPSAAPGLVDQLMENTAALIGVVVVGFGAIVALMRRSRKQAAEEREVESLLASEEFTRQTPSVEPLLATAAAATALGEETPVGTAVEAVAETETASTKTTAETGDPIAEADIYVAYGRYPQAIDLLQGAIRNEPARSDLHVKLLEVFLETQDKAGFQAQFAQLKSLGDGAAIGRVKELMSAFDGVEGWLDSSDLPGDELIQDSEDEQDLYTSDESLLSKGSYSNSVVDDSEYSSDFNQSGHDDALTLDLDDTADVAKTDELVLDLSDLESDSESLASFDTELSLDLPNDSVAADNEFHLNLSLDDELTGSEMAEAEEQSLIQEAELSEEFLASDDDSRPTFDNGFSADLNDVTTDLEATSPDLTFEESLKDLPVNESLSLDSSAISEMPDLGELDQALSELGSDTDLASFDNEFGELLNETSAADLALAEAELSAELPDDFGNEFSADLPESLDFSVSDEFASESTAEIEADLDLSDLDLNNAESDMDSDAAAFTETAFESVPEFTAETAAAESANDDLDFMGDSDEVATKLDLARAYMDMGDADGAKEILDEVLAEGNDDQKGQASELLARIA